MKNIHKIAFVLNIVSVIAGLLMISSSFLLLSKVRSLDVSPTQEKTTISKIEATDPALATVVEALQRKSNSAWVLTRSTFSYAWQVGIGVIVIAIINILAIRRRMPISL